MTTLADWAANGWLVAHRASPTELANLDQIVERELRDAAIEQLSLDARLGMLYNAALKLCDIALRVRGYRAGRDRQHYLTVASLPLTLGDEWRETAQLFDAIRVMRNRGDYESVGIATEQEVEELRVEVGRLRPAVRALLSA